MKLPHQLRVSFFVAQLVATATLLRSIALDRWITVLASLLILGGTLAASRGRTWGLGLAFAAAVAFPASVFIGIAPLWFGLVGWAGAWPFLLSYRALARFDRSAATALTTVAALGGFLGAVCWKAYAFDVFRALPILTPSLHPHHGLALLSTLAAVGAFILRPSARDARASHEDEVGTRTRVAAPTFVRVSPELRLEEGQTDDHEGLETRDVERVSRIAR